MKIGLERVLISDRHRYIAHPHMTRLADGSWVMVVTCGPRRAVTLHPPLDPEFINLQIRSTDEGLTWSAPAAVPHYGAHGAECSGLTAMPDGGVLLNQWRFRWYPEEAAPSKREEPLLASKSELCQILVGSPEFDKTENHGITWCRGGGTTTIWRSDDAGRHWGNPVIVDTGPYSGAYGLRGGVVLDSGAVFIPFSDVPNYQKIFGCWSTDGGHSWSGPQPVAEAEGFWFEEPATLVCGGSRLLMLVRENASRTLYSLHSDDGGKTWSTPVATGMDSYPAHLLQLPDGRVAAVVGRRRGSGSILIYLSLDEGRTWDLANPIVVAEHLGTIDMGYPTAVVSREGGIFVGYYRRDIEGVTGVVGIHVYL